MSEPPTPTDRRTRMLNGAAVALEAVCAVSLWAIVVLLVFNSLERNLLTSSRFSYADAWNGYLMCVLVVLGISVALVDGAHVRIDIFSRLMPARGKSVANVVFRLCGVGAALTIAWGGYTLARQSAATGRIDYGLFEMPLWLPQGLIALGGIIFAAAFLLVPGNVAESNDTDAS